LSAKTGTTKTIQIKLYACPADECLEEVREGVIRCTKGHWIWWSQDSSPTVRRDPVHWPMWGIVDFRGRRSLATKEKKSLFPRQSVKVIESKDELYHLVAKDGGELGWINHQYIVIRINLRRNDRPAPAKIDPARQKELDRLRKKTPAEAKVSIAHRNALLKVLKPEQKEERRKINEELEILKAIE
jgi:hypothetical protein